MVIPSRGNEMLSHENEILTCGNKILNGIKIVNPFIPTPYLVMVMRYLWE